VARRIRFEDLAEAPGKSSAPGVRWMIEPEFGSQEEFGTSLQV
jgi:hypothetical protein